jgi:endonuclease YncB( thermonuclease family)
LSIGGASHGDNRNKPAAGAPQEQPKVVKDTVKGSIHHASGASLSRIIGKVKVVDANTLEFADGTRVALDMVTPDPGQQGTIDGKWYPAGREAAEFLRRHIGDRPVMVFDPGGVTRVYVGDEYVKHTVVIHGWALADHSSLHAAEIIARENKRGLWRGEFVDPAEWRKGKRLPGEK